VLNLQNQMAVALAVGLRGDCLNGEDEVTTRCLSTDLQQVARVARQMVNPPSA